MTGNSVKQSSHIENASGTSFVSTQTGLSTGISSNVALKFYRAQEALKYKAAMELPLTRTEVFGWYLYDFGTSAFQLVIYPFVFPFLLYSLAEEEAWKQHKGKRIDSCNAGSRATNCTRCVLYQGTKVVKSSGYDDMPDLRIVIWRWSLTPMGLVNVAWGWGIVLLVVTLFTVSRLVDYGTHQKKVMAFGVAIGSLACILSLNLWDYPGRWVEGVLLFGAAVAGAGAAGVAYLRCLATMIQASSKMHQVSARGDDMKQERRVYSISNGFSASGTVIGAVGGAAFTAATGFGIFKGLPSVTTMFHTLQMRLLVFVGGIWWAAWALPACAMLRTRQGPAFPGNGQFTFTGGWQDLFSIFSSHDEYKYAHRCLVVIFLASVASYGIMLTIFFLGHECLCMTSFQLTFFGSFYLLTRALAVSAAYFLQKALVANNWIMLVGTLFLMIASPGMIALCNCPSSRLDFSIAAALHGLAAGLFYSYSRTLFLDFTPSGREGPLLGLFTLAGHSGAFTSSLLVSLLTNHTSLHPRRTCLCLLGFIGVALFLLVLLIDNRKGLVSSGHIKIRDDSDDLTASSISSSDILSSPLSCSPVDHFNLGFKLSSLDAMAQPSCFGIRSAVHISDQRHNNNNSDRLSVEKDETESKRKGKGVVIAEPQLDVQLDRRFEQVRRGLLEPLSLDR